MNFKRTTLATSVELQGLGLHSGVPVTMRIHPGDDGIAFRFGEHRALAIPENVTDTTRSTKVGEVGTVEHLMAAFAGLEITDAEVEVSAPEIPGVDGSSMPFVELLQSAGRTEIGEVELPSLYRRVFLQDDAVKIAIGKGTGHWRYEYDVSPRWPGQMAFESAAVGDEFVSQIAPSRTFALSEEVPHLIANNLGLGLDDQSAVILGPEGYKNDVRFPDEPARHKLLDLVGDLYLAGVPVRFLNVVAERSGHRANVRAAAMLFEALRNEGL